ncbi:MAG: hypothetical protein A2Y63_03430 [Candidatus Riflebacteria bacterium RBG_13_59_9]|nr:MAG: hypothetical protein A2Y63_03430 [Candidatus Riflebacteria bacterium RBG_13_59_9]
MARAGARGLLEPGTLVVAAVLFLGGVALGLYAPAEIIPHPFVLLPLALIFLDTALSAMVAAREKRSFNGTAHFLYMVVFATILYVIGALSGIRAELIVLLPLVVRETLVISRLY